MKLKLLPVFCLLFLLSGCGTLRINIDYGISPTSMPESPVDFQSTLNAVSTWTPTASGPALPAASPTPSFVPPTATPTPPEVIDLTASRNHTCAVISTGAVKCWGNNEYGQLGNGTRVNSNLPVDVRGLTDVKAITSGWGHVCALTRSGGVKCWGNNADGELGNGNTGNQSRPVEVAGLASGVTAIDAGDYHTCAVTETNQLKCWGKNTYGQLGDWTKTSRNSPVESPFFGAGVAAVSAGWGHTCVRTTEGWAKCWGNNAYGQMGFGKPTDIHLPAEDVVNLNGRVLEVTADGAQTCALTAGGGAQCWGNNRYGQLGDGTTQKQYEPVQVKGLTSGVEMIEAGWNHACALIRGAELLCWGWNFYGQLGDGTTVNRGAPARVQFLTDGVKTIAVGWGHTCVVTERDMVKCWGLNGSGQLGDGTWTDSTIPLTVIGLASENSELVPTTYASPTTDPVTPAAITPTNTLTPTKEPFGVLEVSASGENTCALLSNGSVKCWGDNTHGQLGDGTTTQSALPVDVGGLNGKITTVITSGFHACALFTNGGMKCWGANIHGELGIGMASDSSMPVEVTVFDGAIRSMALGAGHTCVLTEQGGVKCWGDNRYGQLGDGSNVSSLTPVDVRGLTHGVVSISAGAFYTCGLTERGGVKCWGDNLFGSLGDGTCETSNIPVDVSRLESGVVKIALGEGHACALMATGGAQCWGNNESGQLGDNSLVYGLTPKNVNEPANDFVDIKAGYYFTCAQIKSGGVKCWGNHGLIGPQTDHRCDPNSYCASPTDVLGLAGWIKSLEVGSEHACIITDSGKLVCWGANLRGQLGDGTTTDRPAPGVRIDL